MEISIVSVLTGRFCGRYNLTTAGAFVGCSEAAAGDLNNDGISEIVFCTYSTENGKSHLVILSSDGKLLHRVPLEKRGSMAAPTIADVDNDGVLR